MIMKKIIDNKNEEILELEFWSVDIRKKSDLDNKKSKEAQDADINKSIDSIKKETQIKLQKLMKDLKDNKWDIFGKKWIQKEKKWNKAPSDLDNRLDKEDIKRIDWEKGGWKKVPGMLWPYHRDAFWRNPFYQTIRRQLDADKNTKDINKEDRKIIERKITLNSLAMNQDVVDNLLPELKQINFKNKKDKKTREKGIDDTQIHLNNLIKKSDYIEFDKFVMKIIDTFQNIKKWDRLYKLENGEFEQIRGISARLNDEDASSIQTAIKKFSDTYRQWKDNVVEDSYWQTEDDLPRTFEEILKRKQKPTGNPARF